MMYARTLHRLLRERQREGASVVVSVPLIVVVLVEDVARLPVHDIQGGIVEVREIDRKTLGGPEVGRNLLHRLAVARERLASRPRALLQDRKVAPEGMLNVHAMHAPPLP